MERSRGREDGLVEIVCQKYEVKGKEKRVENEEGVDPSRKYETRGMQRKRGSS